MAKSKNSKKRKRDKMARSKNIDIVGVFLSDYGLTGENIAIQIFSHLDFSSLTKGLLVCETWNQFLTKDRSVWLKMLEKTRPALEYLTNELSNANEDERKVWQEFFETLKTKEDIKFDKISRLFKKIMGIFSMIQEWQDANNHVPGPGGRILYDGYYLPENFNDDFFGQSLTGDFRIRLQSDPQYDSFFRGLQSSLVGIECSKTKKEEAEHFIACGLCGECEYCEDYDVNEIDMPTESLMRAYPLYIKKSQSNLLERIKKEIISSVLTYVSTYDYHKV